MASCELSPLAQPACEWTCDSRKFRVYFAPDVMERMGSESWMAFKSVPHRGLEIGGILLGRKISDANATAFWIDGFQSVESEHRTGPSYVLSDSDWTVLQAALIKSGEAGIGIFRSNTRRSNTRRSNTPGEQTALHEQDVQLFQRCFDSSEAVFMMLEPASKAAAIFAPLEGTLGSVYEFGLISPIASIMGPRQANLEPPLFQDAETRLPPPRRLDVSDCIPHVPRTRPDRRMRALPIPVPEEKFLPEKMRDWVVIATLSAAIFAVTVGTYSYFHPLPKVAAPAQKEAVSAAKVAPRASYEHLNLRVERAGSSLELLWDGNAPSVRSATHAVLHITDGGSTSERNLSAALLETGSFTYQPKSSEETFQLDVYSDVPAGTGVIQVMNPPLQNTIPFVKQQASPAAAPPVQSAVPEVSTPIPENSTSAPLIPEKKDVSPTPAKPAAPKIEDPPIARSLSPAEPEKRKQPASPAIPVSYATYSTGAGEPRVQMFAEAVPDSRMGRIVGKIPLVRRLKRPSRVASPVPVFEAQPKVHLSPADRPAGPVAVNIKIRVAESGTVMLAEVEDYGDPPNWRLAAAALEAARRWTFQPARVEETAVPSDVILHFRFTP